MRKTKKEEKEFLINLILGVYNEKELKKCSIDELKIMLDQAHELYKKLNKERGN